MGAIALRDMQDRAVEVKRLDLIDTLNQNKEAHILDYNESLAGYKQAAAKKLQEDGAKATARLEKRLK